MAGTMIKQSEPIKLHYPVHVQGMRIGIDDSCCIVIDPQGHRTITVTDVQYLAETLAQLQQLVPLVEETMVRDRQKGD